MLLFGYWNKIAKNRKTGFCSSRGKKVFPLQGKGFRRGKIPNNLEHLEFNVSF